MSNIGRREHRAVCAGGEAPTQAGKECICQVSLKQGVVSGAI
jgi:hypothetical protein